MFQSDTDVITALTDGACSGNPGPGGWAVEIDGHLESGWIECTTNNSMEMLAVLQALHLSPISGKIRIVTDSKLVIGWLSGGWKCKHDHIRQIRDAIFDVIVSKSLIVEYELVKGHNGHAGNHRVDRAAHAQAQLARNLLAVRRRQVA
jgi:ribonuclease HI